MPPAHRTEHEEPARFPRLARRALGRYVLAWMLPALLLASVLLPLLDGREEGWRTAGRAVADAAQVAGCTLRAELGRLSEDYLRAAHAGRLDAVRRGVVVVQYGRSLPQRDVRALRGLAAARPGLVAVRSESFAARPAFTAIAWRRVLDCDDVSRRALRAVRTLHEHASSLPGG